MRAIRVATICHNEDDYRDQNHRRVTLVLRRDRDKYRWYGVEEDGTEYDTEVSAGTVAQAEDAACHAWGAMEWDLQTNGAWR